MKKIIILMFLVGLIALQGCNKSEVKVSSDGLLSNPDAMEINQTYFDTGIHSFAKGNGGYYYLSYCTGEEYKRDGGVYLHYFDSTQKKAIKLCSRADCSHRSSECDAYLGKTDYTSSVYYYGDKLYLLKRVDGNANLVRCKADGSEREDLGAICASSGENDIRMTFCGDYAYAIARGESIENEDVDRIYRFSLTDKKSEVVYEYKGEGANVDRIRSDGGFVYFTAEKIVKNQETGIYTRVSDGVVTINNSTLEIKTVIEGDISDYALDSQNRVIYYYVTGEGLYRYSIVDGSTNKMSDADVETNWCELSYDGNYVYTDNSMWRKWSRAFGGVKDKMESKCMVYTPEGKKVCDISLKGVVMMHYGDSNYLFAFTNEGAMTYLDKSNLDNAEFRLIEEQR